MLSLAVLGGDRPDLPADWRLSPIAELAETNPSTLAAATPQEFTFGYVDLSAVEKGRIDWSQVRAISYREAPSRARRPVMGGDVLFGTVRPALQSHGAIPEHEQGPLVASTGFTVLRARPGEADGRYLFHSVMGALFAVQARRTEVGSNYPAVNESDVRQFLVAHPEVPEQRRIATILDTLDDAIRQTEQVIAKLKAMKQGLLHDLLTRGIDDNGELRPPPDEAPHLYKDSPLGRIPKGWEVRRIGTLLTELQQGWSPDCDAAPAAAGAWGVLKTTSVAWSGYDDSANKALPRNLSPRPEYEVRANDALMTRAGPNSRVGVVALVTSTQGRLMLSDKLYRLVPHVAEIEAAYLVLALSGRATQQHLSTLKTGLAESQTNISQAIVRSLWLSLPKRDEQSRICDAYSSLSRQQDGECAGLAKLRTLKLGLMDDLLTGRVRTLPDGGV